MAKKDDRETLIRKRAHEIWERHGRPHGKDEANWHEAAKEIDAELGGAAKPKPAARVTKPKAPKSK